MSVPPEEEGEGNVNVVKIGLWEKRLKPVYGSDRKLVQNKNYKKAIAEIDKLVRRQPNFTCAKALKGLAILRMGKIDEARRLILPVLQEVPTDDDTLDILSVFCYELDEPHSLCAILEAACSKKPTEYSLCMYFTSNVHVEDHQKQHIIALNMYKSFKKTQYFAWAIQSLILKFEKSSQEVKKGKLDILPLQLVERMCEKFIAEATSSIEEGILYFYLVALEKLEKWEKLLQVMKEHGYPKDDWSSIHYHQIFCTSLTKLGRLEDRFEYLKSKFMANPDEYDVLREIVTTSDESQIEAVLAFMNELRESNPSREVALADLHFCREHPQHVASIRMEEDLKMAIKYGGRKLSLYSDLADSFQLIKKYSLSDAVLKLITPIYSDTDDSDDKYYDSMNKVIKDVNFEMLSREIRPVDTPFDRLKRADRCFGKYLACEKAAKEKLIDAENIEAADPHCHDRFLILSASSLIAHYHQYPSNHDEMIADLIKHNKNWICNDEHPKELNELRSEMDPILEIADLSRMNLKDCLLGCKDLVFLFITAIMLMEYGLQRDRYNRSHYILLAKSYLSFGANAHSMKLLEHLGLKSEQWDSMGYLLMFTTLNGGMYDDALTILTMAEDMYFGHMRGCMDNVIEAYRYGSLHKISEFVGFRDQLINSIQCGLVFCEKRLLNYVMHTNSPADLRTVAKTICLELDNQLLDKSDLFDNRDYTVLQGLAESINWDYVKKISADADTHFFNVRMTLLFCLSKLVNHLGNLDDAEERADLISLICLFDKQVTTWETTYYSYEEVDTQTPLLHGIWPPQLQKYSEAGSLNVLKDMLGYIKDLLKSEEIDQPPLEGLNGILMTSCMLLLRNLSGHKVTGEFRPMKELSLDTRFTKLHFVLETFSFMRILLECSIEIDKHRLHIWKMDKKKKGRMAAMTGHKKLLQESITILHDGATKIVKFIDSFESKMKSYGKTGFLRKFDILRVSEIVLKSGFMFKPFKDHFSSFFTELERSLISQAQDVRKVAQNLVDYIVQMDA